MPVKLWTPEEYEQLHAYAKQGMGWTEIGRKMGRSESSIRSKASRLGMICAPMKSVWTDEISKYHRELYNTGVSHSKLARIISAKFGVELTRNASISRAHRDNYPDRAAQRTGRPPKSGKRRIVPSIGSTKPHIQPGLAFHGGTRPGGASKPLPSLEPGSTAPIPLHITLLELTNSTCKWPVTDHPPHAFCGHPSEHGSSYCPHHRAKSVNTVQRKPKVKQDHWDFGCWLSRKKRGSKPANMDIAEFWEAS